MKQPSLNEPQEGHTILIGIIGLASRWHYFDDTVKGREAAQRWLGGGVQTYHRLFRVHFADVREMVLTEPVAAKLVEKSKESFLD